MNHAWARQIKNGVRCHPKALDHLSLLGGKTSDLGTNCRVLKGTGGGRNKGSEEEDNDWQQKVVRRPRKPRIVFLTTDKEALRMPGGRGCNGKNIPHLKFRKLETIREMKSPEEETSKRKNGQLVTRTSCKESGGGGGRGRGPDQERQLAAASRTGPVCANQLSHNTSDCRRAPW